MVNSLLPSFKHDHTAPLDAAASLAPFPAAPTPAAYAGGPASRRGVRWGRLPAALRKRHGVLQKHEN